MSKAIENMQKIVNKVLENIEIDELNKMRFAGMKTMDGQSLMAIIIVDDDGERFFKSNQVEGIRPKFGFKFDKNTEGQGLDITLSLSFDTYEYETIIRGNNKKYQKGVLEALEANDMITIAIVNDKKELVRPISVKLDMNQPLQM